MATAKKGNATIFVALAQVLAAIRCKIATLAGRHYSKNLKTLAPHIKTKIGAKEEAR